MKLAFVLQRVAVELLRDYDRGSISVSQCVAVRRSVSHRVAAYCSEVAA